MQNEHKHIIYFMNYFNNIFLMLPAEVKLRSSAFQCCNISQFSTVRCAVSIVYTATKINIHYP